MKRDRKIYFKQVDDTHIDVMMEYKEFVMPGERKNPEEKYKLITKKVGCIHTPSSNGGDIADQSIQVCGISDAYNYWGCGVYAKPKLLQEGLGYRHYMYNHKGDVIMEQVRDIQLFFDEDTIAANVDSIDDCWGCFNTPCTCDNKEKKRMFTSKKNPYELKTHKDLGREK